MTPSQAEKIIRQIVFKYVDRSAFKVFLFGSRASGTSKKLSDFDVGVLGSEPLSVTTAADMADELEESSIPYIVEVVDFYSVSDTFKKLALKDAVLWN